MTEDTEYTGYSIESSDAFEYVSKELGRLDDYLQRYLIETEQEEATNSWGTPSPFYNTGIRFENDTFHAWAYKWAEEPWEYEYTYDEYKELYPDYIHDNEQNFLHYESGVRISWYKHFRRGTYAHGQATRDIIEQRRLGEIINDCISSLVLEDGRTAWDLPKIEEEEPMF